MTTRMVASLRNEEDDTPLDTIDVLTALAPEEDTEQSRHDDRIARANFVASMGGEMTSG